MIFFHLMLFTCRLVDSQTFLNFGAVGAASVTLVTWCKSAPIAARQKTTMEPIRDDSGGNREMMSNKRTDNKKVNSRLRQWNN